MSNKGRFTIIKGIDDLPMVDYGGNYTPIVRYSNKGPAAIQLKIASGSSYDLKPGDCFEYAGNVIGAKIPSNESWDAAVLKWKIINPAGS